MCWCIKSLYIVGQDGIEPSLSRHERDALPIKLLAQKIYICSFRHRFNSAPQKSHFQKILDFLFLFYLNF